MTAGLRAAKVDKPHEAKVLGAGAVVAKSEVSSSAPGGSSAIKLENVDRLEAKMEEEADGEGCLPKQHNEPSVGFDKFFAEKMVPDENQEDDVARLPVNLMSMDG